MEDSIIDLNMGRRSQENRRRSNKTTLRKYRNLSNARTEDPLSKGRFGQNNNLVKDKLKDSESSKEKDEKANSYTCILKRSHDQQESRKKRNREATSHKEDPLLKDIL